MIFLISYFSGINGSSTSEWADDKFYGIKKNYSDNIKLFTSYKSKLKDKDIIKIPSVSFKDYKNEIKNKKLGIGLVFYFIITLTLGIFLDLFFKFFIRGNSESKWSWTISGFFVIFFKLIKEKPKFIFTTGGAASAHLIALILKFFFNFKFIVEFQDPLVGEDIGRNLSSKKYFLFLEKIIVNKADKIIFVSKEASLQCKSRNNFNKKITYIYPGVSKIDGVNYNFNLNKNAINMVHFGTLYSNRNINNLILALENLINENKIDINDVKIHNLGDIYCKELKYYRSKKYFKDYKSIEKTKALKLIENYNILLLIQHKDQRSKITIPYKFYDYLNFNCPIFGITNNEELDEILVNNGHYHSNNSSVSEIEKSLIKIKEDIIIKKQSKIYSNPFIYDIAIKKIFDLDYDKFS